MMVSINKQLLNPRRKLHLPRRGWQHAILKIGSSQRSISQGNKYQVALAQITTSLGSSKTSMAFAVISFKLMNKGTHQRADVVGMVMAQVSLKAALKKWGREAEESIAKEMKQLHW
jgi:hypothetical protein